MTTDLPAEQPLAPFDFAMISTEAGLLINPGSKDFTMVIPPIAAQTMRRDFAG